MNGTYHQEGQSQVLQLSATLEAPKNINHSFSFALASPSSSTSSRYLTQRFFYHFAGFGKKVSTISGQHAYYRIAAGHFSITVNQNGST
jgi:hypothetical protein